MSAPRMSVDDARATGVSLPLGFASRLTVRPTARSAIVRGLLVALVGALCLTASISARAEATGIDLEGTWYVLTHYRDDATAEPDADRWSDRIWRFERRGRRLVWTEYAIVVFRDQAGRFEMLGSSRASRVLHAWRPNDRQLAEIREGLRTNARGIRTKTLRGSPEKGYGSGGGLRAESTSVIGYQESWTIEGLPDEPVFARSDLMGSGRTEDLEGRTEYATEQVLDGGARLRGRFARDGHQEGSFEMMRAGDVESVGPNERQSDRPLGTP